MSDEPVRITLGPVATALAAQGTGDPTAKNLEKAIRDLQDIAEKRVVNELTEQLSSIYEGLATLQLMMLANSADKDSQISEAVERMSIRSAILIQKTTELRGITGPKLTLLAERMRLEHQLNERGIHDAEQSQERGGREQ